MDITFEMNPLCVERLSVEEFLRRHEEIKPRLKNLRIIPPSLGDAFQGDDDFGSIQVEYTSPVYSRVIDN